MDNKEVALTTIDNPYDPFTQFEEWYRYDEDKGYHTCSYLARKEKTSNELSDIDNESEIDKAIDDIIRLNLNGKYKKVFK